MRSRTHLERKTGGTLILTQSDRDYAENNYYKYDAILSVNHQGPLTPMGLLPEFCYLHRPVRDEDTPTQDDIQAWINFGVGNLNGGKNLLVCCEAGQNRSVIVSSLIEAMWDKRNWWSVVEVYHEEMLKEDPPSNWWPYDHWEKVISEWLMKLVVRPPASPIVPPPLSPISMEEAIRMSGGTRPDFLGSLYKYTKMLPPPALVVELGTCRAESTVAIAAALKGTGGHLITIDPVFKTGEVWILDAHMRGPGCVVSDGRDVLNKLAALGLAQYVSIYSDYSWNVLSQWAGEEIDLLFVDGAHYPDDLKADLEWTRLIKPKGFLVVDDWFKEIKEVCLAYLIDKPFHLLHESTNAPTPDYCVTIFQKI